MKSKFIVKRDNCFILLVVSDIYFSHGSVRTYLWCGGIFNDCFITHLLLSLRWKSFENWSTFGKVMGKSRMYCFFTHGYICIWAMCFNPLSLSLLKQQWFLLQRYSRS